MAFTVNISLTTDLLDIWESIPKFERSATIQRLLREEFGAAKITKKKTGKRDPGTSMVYDTWKEILGVFDGNDTEQRRYASLLSKKYGDKTVNAIKLVKVIRASDEELKPTFGNLKDVYYKWSKIEDFYNRHQPKKEARY